MQMTVVSQHQTAAQAFAAIDALSQQMVRTGAPPNAVELIVVDSSDNIVERRGS